MHPQAINQLLDAEASKWVQSEDDALHEAASDGSDSVSKQLASPTQQQLSLEDRSQVRSLATSEGTS